MPSNLSQGYDHASSKMLIGIVALCGILLAGISAYLYALRLRWREHAESLEKLGALSEVLRELVLKLEAKNNQLESLRRGLRLGKEEHVRQQLCILRQHLANHKEQLTIAQAEMALTSRQPLINVDGAYVAAVSGVAVGSAGLFALRKRKCGGILANLDGVYAQMDASRRLMKELNSLLFQEEAPDRPL
jgi:hypothetical protein